MPLIKINVGQRSAAGTGIHVRQARNQGLRVDGFRQGCRAGDFTFEESGRDRKDEHGNEKGIKA
jgi:hypothetical protein